MSGPEVAGVEHPCLQIEIDFGFHEMVVGIRSPIRSIPV